MLSDPLRFSAFPTIIWRMTISGGKFPAAQRTINQIVSACKGLFSPLKFAINGID